MENSINPLTLKPVTNKYLEGLESVQKLPIWKYRDQILDTVRNNIFTILTAGTGAGKTRVTPRFLLPLLSEFGGLMIITEPKRISAIQGAKTFAGDMDVEVGTEIGYKIRYESKTSDITKVQFITEGIFLQEISNNPSLDNYSIVLLDEVHERGLNMDIMLAMLKFVNPQKIRIVLMSATIDTVKFSNYFNDAPVITVEGAPQTITTYYTLNSPADRFQDAILKAIEICEGDIEGDIILFVGGSEDAEFGCRKFNELYANKGGTKAFCVTLYADLSQEKQSYAKDAHEPGKRKVIFSTNLAEASVTINTASFVIDIGTHKESSFEVKTRASILQATFISKASANQRRGRVGRVKPGYVYRMYTQEEFNSMPDYTIPEILRSNLEDELTKILNMFDNYIKNVGETELNIEFLDEPPKKLVQEAMSVLEKEKIVMTQDKSSKDIFDYELTPLGIIISKFPVTHQQARTLVLAYRNNTTNQLISILAMISIRSPFVKVEKDKKYLVDDVWKSFNLYRNKFYGDHFGLLNIFEEFKNINQDKRRKWCQDNFISCIQMDTVLQTYIDLKDLIEKRRIKSESKISNDPKAISRTLLEGFFLNIAIRLGNNYIMVYSDTNARISNSSILRFTKPKYILYTSLSKADNVYYMSGCYEFELKTLLEVSPRMFDETKKLIKKYGLKE